jgi:hypothetical protein
MIAKIAIQKISILATNFSIYIPTDYLFYYYFVLESEIKRWRERVKERD